MNQSAAKVATPSRPRHVKIGYGVAEMGIMAAEMMVRLYAMKFYTESVGLSPKLTGIALALAAIWDAVSDPLMGAISDNTPGRWGPRRPYIAIGGALLALSLLLLFSPPALGSQGALMAYLVGATLFLNTAITIIGVPHLALGGEITFDRDERTEVYGWRLLFDTLGILIGFGIPGLLLAAQVQAMKADGTAPLVDPAVDKTTAASEATRAAMPEALPTATVIMGVMVVLAALVTVWATRSVKVRPERRAMRLRQLPHALWTLARSPVLVPLLAAFFIANIGLTTNSNLALYYYEYTLRLTQQQTNIVLFTFILVMCPSILVWVLISRRWGKRKPAFVGILTLGIVTSVGYPLLPPESLAPTLLVVLVAGFCVGAVILLDSLLADLVDLDELLTGANREGLMFGLWRLAAKLGRAAGMLFGGYMLGYIGFAQGDTTISPGTARGLAWLFGPGVGIFFIIGAMLFYLMRFTDDDHIRVQRILQRRRERRKRREADRAISEV